MHCPWVTQAEHNIYDDFLSLSFSFLLAWFHFPKRACLRMMNKLSGWLVLGHGEEGPQSNILFIVNLYLPYSSFNNHFYYSEIRENIYGIYSKANH